MKIYELLSENADVLIREFYSYLTSIGKRFAKAGGMKRENDPIEQTSATLSDLKNFCTTKGYTVPNQIYSMPDIERNLLTYHTALWYLKKIL